MNLYLIFLYALLQLPNRINPIGTCSPNSQFIINGLLCVCNHEGIWDRVSCTILGRRSPCAPGEVHQHSCSHCTCHRGNFLCDHTLCPDKTTNFSLSPQLSYFGPSCVPFRSYYFNCSLCICPASGKTSEARCIVDLSCPLMDNGSFISQSSVQNACMANVIYLFPCLQCVCSETGRFVYKKCVEKCHKSIGKTFRRCVVGSIYRENCNVCRCPENGVHSDVLCQRVKCGNKTTHPITRTQQTMCTPHAFTEPKCYYCDCKQTGVVDDSSCVEVSCSELTRSRRRCFPGEVTPLCIECFCLRNRTIKSEYCTRNCFDQSKLLLLEKILKNSFDLIDDKQIASVEGNDKCKPNFLYLNEDRRYCLCPKRDRSKKVCTMYYRHMVEPARVYTNEEIDYNATCKPSTLVEFGCNVCYCSKSGRIDANWCTTDDCKAINQIKESHRSFPIKVPTVDFKSMCIPGSITRMQCNFCICPESGLARDRVCTKNECKLNQIVPDDDFICEPLSYYKVDCNVCLCPKDGLKNVAKCTKIVCESNFLRSGQSCTPGRLFVEECNICVCPINGEKSDMACTNHLCEKQSWKVLKAANAHISPVNVKRNLDVCFPGEEYIQGCNLCICPEEGLKTYSICEDLACKQKRPYSLRTSLMTVTSRATTELLVLEGTPSSANVSTTAPKEYISTLNSTDVS